jgi:predicted  nucleic acid-binding Zn-ribbon protein
MPGYDFFEFYKEVGAAGNQGSQMYNMAFQMASALDKTITVQKLVSDAEFYISKINEVHSQYSSQGQLRLNDIQEKKVAEKSKLSNEIDQSTQRIAQLRVELQNLENDVRQKREKLSKIDEGFIQQENSIREKMAANDAARNSSIDKLNTVKNGIGNFLK